MFQKQPFGTTTTGFGSFNSGATTSSPFGGFKPTAATSAFGAAPAFGSTPANTSTTGGGLFGQTNTTGGLFGASTSANATPAFGSSGFGSFGASTSTGGLFGANTTSTGLFGNTQNNTAFGAKPTGFGFGSTPTAGPSTSGLFSTGASTSSGLFSQPTNTLGGGTATGGLFSSNTGAFGQQQATGTAHVKYHPVVGNDVVVKSGASQTINIRHHCITCMKEYENKSLEELRLEDYTAGRKGGSSGMFGFQQPADNTVKPLFNSSFGQPATTTASNLFGGGTLGTTSGFGQNSTFSFGNNAQNTTTTGLFGANKPAFGATPTTGTGLFGATTTQAPAFGTNTSTFGFGSTAQNQQSGGLFGAKPTTGAFGSSASSGFGSFGGGGLFGAKTQQTTAPTFGTATPAFGATSSAFGANTSTSLFGGGSTFGKPATTQPTFGFNSQPTLGSGLGTGLGSTFQTKPNTFGTTIGGGTSLFPQQTNTFQTGLNTGLGGGLFNNNSTLGGTGLGLGQTNANSLMPGGGLGASVGSSVHEQILTLAARPYGDSPLFKDLLPDSTTADDALKPTNPAAVKAVLDSSNAAYRVTSPTGSRLKVVPRAVAQDKKSLFDGLEESDASLEDKLTLRPSRKRLVLRPNSDNLDNCQNNNRSIDEPRQENGISQVDKSNSARRDRETEYYSISKSKERLREQNTDSELRSDKRNSWPSRISCNEEKSIDDDTPRLYPNLDKEMPSDALESERRASWLTTKPLRKPSVSNPEMTENSVRELGLKEKSTSTDKENVDTFYSESQCLQFCSHRGGGQTPCSTCEKIAHQIQGVYVSEEENVSTREAPPHPAGVKLTRPGYYTIPSLEEMIKYIRSDGKCIVPHLTIGRKNYGNVFYDCEMDITDMDLDALVHFLNKEVIIYPEDSEKPPLGEGLNRRAIVTLDRVWPRDKTEKRPVTEPERLLKMDYEGKLRRVCDKYDTKFIEYRPQTGSWVFRVEHFSKYGLTESDEEDEIAPEVMKRQLVNQSLQTAAATVQKPPAAPVTSASGLGGLGSSTGIVPNMTVGSTAGLGGMGFSSSLSGEDMFLQTSLNLMNGSKGFEMDTTEDNADATSLYQESRAFGVKSPTSELARLEHRHSHNVQLMKASLYAETEMDDDVSVSTGDQLVPHATASVVSLPPTSTTHAEVVEEAPITVEEPVVRPLVVNPHTVILKYHKKVPPFKKTIAGRLNADCIADMSVCRARHSRVCFGPSNALVYNTTHDVITDLPQNADLSELGRYVVGRSDEDWSEAVVARVRIGQADGKAVVETLRRQLQSLLDFSNPEDDTQPCSRLIVQQSPVSRKQLLEKFLEDATKDEYNARFGVSSSYCVQVWKLCEALWGEDLLNDGIPGTDEQSIVSRHEDLLKWLKEAVSEVTEAELLQPVDVDPEDEKDGHSARVWTLLLGGRILEACKLCKENGDFNMATLVAQAYGDPYFKTLISRQLHIWKECGADELISAHKWAILSLLAGQSPTRELEAVDWVRVLNVCARYICPQIPTLEQIVRTYQNLFSRDSDVDLTTVPEESVNMRLPTPDYFQDYTFSIDTDGSSRRILDLRYELIRARAFNSRPRLQPASYSPHPMDYSLSFLLGCWFGKPSIESITGLAEQLEAYGEWHLAVQALFYHPDEKIRTHLIRELITRHAPAEADTPELKPRLEFVENLGVPEKWLLLARAYKAKYEHRAHLEAECLVGAGAWNAAHSVLVDQLLPEVVLSDNVKSIQPIIDKLSEAARRNEVSGWESGGEALYHYIYVCDEIRGLVSAAEGREAEERSSVACRLEALTPRLAAACRALTLFKSKSPRALAARAEMGARLIQLALAGGHTSAHLTTLLSDLDLPPDCAAHAHYKITSDLADQALP